MTERYPDRPATASDGEAFAELCIKLHYDLLGEEVVYHRSGMEQLTLGESKNGIEFKHLQNSRRKLHIELRERTSLTAKWVPSGIYADDRMTRYCCGNADDIWVFWTADLRDLATKFTTRYYHATVESMVLHKYNAHQIYLYRFQRQPDGDYVLTRRVP